MDTDYVFCGCGFEDGEHLVSSGKCCREIAEGNKIPTNFRMEVWTHYAGTDSETTFLTKVCDVDGITITEYTLYNQRLYAYDEENKVWTKLKKY